MVYYWWLEIGYMLLVMLLYDVIFKIAPWGVTNQI